MEDDYFENMNTEYEFDCFNDEEYYNLKVPKTCKYCYLLIKIEAKMIVSWLEERLFLYYQQKSNHI